MSSAAPICVLVSSPAAARARVTRCGSGSRRIAAPTTAARSALITAALAGAAGRAGSAASACSVPTRVRSRRLASMDRFLATVKIQPRCPSAGRPATLSRCRHTRMKTSCSRSADDCRSPRRPIRYACTAERWSSYRQRNSASRSIAGLDGSEHIGSQELDDAEELRGHRRRAEQCEAPHLLAQHGLRHVRENRQLAERHHGRGLIELPEEPGAEAGPSAERPRVIAGIPGELAEHLEPRLEHVAASFRGGDFPGGYDQAVAHIANLAGDDDLARGYEDVAGLAGPVLEHGAG